MVANLGLTKNARHGTDAPMRSFALRVVSELARGSNNRQAPRPLPHLATLLMQFARQGEAARLGEIFAEMKRQQLLAEDILDVYLPQTVRDLGNQWHDDQIDILQASMAFTRLQTLLRELSHAWASDRVSGATGGRVLLMMPSCEQHSLSAMFAANHLRRAGVSVKVLLAPTGRQIAEIMRRSRFHGVFISVSNLTSLEGCAAIVGDLRKCDGHSTPIVLGGGLVSGVIADIDTSRIADVSGADIVTNDIVAALHFCGIRQFCVAAE